MSYRDRANAAVQTIGTQLGKSLTLDDHGALTLEFAGGRLCWLEVSEADSRVVMSAPVAAAHGEARTAMFEAALQANLHSPRTDHGIVGFDQEGQQLVLMGAFGGDMDAERSLRRSAHSCSPRSRFQKSSMK